MSRPDDYDHIHEMFAGFGPVVVRRMFGGAGLFSDGLMFALLDEGVVYLKADEDTRPAFVSEGLGPFTYPTKDGDRVITSYWRMPERLYDDADELARWATEALAVARRASASRPRAKARRKDAPRRRSKP